MESGVYFTPQQIVLSGRSHQQQPQHQHQHQQMPSNQPLASGSMGTSSARPYSLHVPVPPQAQSSLATFSHASKFVASRDPAVVASIENAYDRRVSEAHIALDNLRHVRDRHVTARGHAAAVEARIHERTQAHLATITAHRDALISRIENEFQRAVAATHQVRDVLMMPVHKNVAAIERNVAEIDRVVEMVHLKFQCESKAEFVHNFPILLPAVREAVAMDCPTVQPVDFNALKLPEEFLHVGIAHVSPDASSASKTDVRKKQPPTASRPASAVSSARESKPVVEGKDKAEKDEIIRELTASYKELEAMKGMNKVHGPDGKSSLMDEYLATQIGRLADTLTNRLSRLEELVEEQKIERMEKKIARGEQSTSNAAADQKQRVTSTASAKSLKSNMPSAHAHHQPQPQTQSQAPAPAPSVPRSQPALPQGQALGVQTLHNGHPLLRKPPSGTSSYEYVYEVVNSDQGSLQLGEGEEVVAEEYI
jgi:hypothetical protein